MNRIYGLVKEFSTLSQAVKIARITMVILLTAAIVGILLLGSYTGSLNRGIAENLIRLHVIANSDSPEDQAIKREVRDAVLSYVQGELSGSKDIEHTRSVISGGIDRITAVASEVVSSHGNSSPVKVSLGSYPFPTKAYGDIVLPAGNYQALRIVIGKGEGSNWWCVLFPPLCFVDVTHGTVPDSAKDGLKEVLTDEEYGIVTSADEESDIPIKIKFKIVELFQESKIKFASAINRIFKSP